jgi:hypothetical protein
MNDLYVYLYNKTSGGGHKVRAESWKRDNKGGDILEISKEPKKDYRRIIVDAMNCPAEKAAGYRLLSSELIFIDDYGRGAMNYADQIVATIPHWKFPDDKRIIRAYPTNPKKFNVMIYCGYDDPHRLMIKTIREVREKYPTDMIICRIGDGFSRKYINEIQKEKVECTKFEQCLPLIEGEWLIFATWGLYYLELSQIHPVIPIVWDGHTKKLRRHYFK